MDTTATTEREVKTLPFCDVDAWNTEGAAYVAARVPDDATAEERARAAGKIAKDEFKNVEKYRPLRDEAAYALHAHYRLRRGANLAGAVGVNRTRWKAMKDERLKKGPIPDMENAPKVLADMAKRTARANGRFKAARDVRDAAVAELLAMRDDAGKVVWKNSEVAELIGTDPSRVSHIKTRGHAA